MELAQLVTQVVNPQPQGPSLKELRAQLTKATGAPVSPKMSQASIILALDKVAKGVEPAKPAPSAKRPVRGIGARILVELKAGTSPQKTLEIIKETFDGCQTTMACVYWYKSKINSGLM